MNQQLPSQPSWVDGILVERLSKRDPDFRRDLYNSKILDHHSVSLLPKTSAWIAKNYFENGGIVGATDLNGRRALFYQVFTLKSLRHYPDQWNEVATHEPRVISHGLALLRETDRPYVTDEKLMNKISQCELLL